MAILSCYICLLAILLHQSIIQASDLDALMTNNVNQQKEIVDKHNSLRRAVHPSASNMLKMEWNSETASNAQHRANQCTIKQNTPGSRELNGVPCGENVFMSSIPVPWSDVIQNWYNNINNFRHGSGATSKNAKIGLYTQLVWYNSYQVGCACASCPNQRLYKYLYVCQYCPAGNNVNQMATPYKEGQPCGDCPAACDNGLCTNPCKYPDKYSNCPALKTDYGCGIPLMKDCQASCKCTTEIQ